MKTGGDQRAPEAGITGPGPVGLRERIALLWDWLVAKAVPWELRWWEAALMRLFFALLVYFETFPPVKERFATQPRPNGLAEWGFDFTFFADPQLYELLSGIGVVALAFYVLGVLPVLCLPYLAWFSIATKTLANSQGGISHSYQMVSLILLAQAIVALWCFIAGLRRGDRGALRLTSCLVTGGRLDRFGLYYTQAVIVACYVTAGITKLIHSGGMWLWNTPYIVKDLVKTDRQNFYSQLNEGGAEVAYVGFILEHPMLARVLFSPGLLLELAAVLALFGRGWSFWVGVALISMHLGIDLVMGLNFKIFELTVLIFLVNLPWWAVVAGRRVAGARSGDCRALK